VAGSCEHDNEHFDYIKCVVFLDQLSDYHILRSPVLYVLPNVFTVCEKFAMVLHSVRFYIDDKNKDFNLPYIF
jgi:hypothetical protein